MKLSYVRSDAVYKKIMEAPVEKKNDIYRYELMMPFKGKWDCYQIPMKAAMRNAGYTDVERGERGSSEEHLTVTQFK